MNALSAAATAAIVIPIALILVLAVLCLLLTLLLLRLLLLAVLVLLAVTVLILLLCHGSLHFSAHRPSVSRTRPVRCSSCATMETAARRNPVSTDTLSLPVCAPPIPDSFWKNKKACPIFGTRTLCFSLQEKALLSQQRSASLPAETSCGQLHSCASDPLRKPDQHA